MRLPRCRSTMKEFQAIPPIDSCNGFIFYPEKATNLFPDFGAAVEKDGKTPSIVMVRRNARKETAMEYSPGCVFSLAEKNAPIPGCTVSEDMQRRNGRRMLFARRGYRYQRGDLLFPQAAHCRRRDARSRSARQSDADASRAGRSCNARRCPGRDAHRHIRRLS